LLRPVWWCEVKNTPIAAVAATLLAVPASQAAIDDAGMQYTSAAEGFYGSLRLGFFGTSDAAEENDDGDVVGTSESDKIDTVSSRLGVRGTADLGGGLTASYRYEFSVSGDNSSAIGNTRLQNVGLSGGFGSLLIGTQWALDYNTVWGNTDVMNLYSGNLAYNDDRAGRQSNAITYTSPDFNGFSFGTSAVVDPNSISARKAGNAVIRETTTTTVVIDLGDDNAIGGTAGAVDTLSTVTVTNEVDLRDAAVTAAGYEEADAIDKWVVAASYSRAGFDVGGTYVRRAVTSRTVTGSLVTGTPNVASITTTDTEINPTTYGVSFGYGQDNWSLDYWYGRTDQDDTANTENTLHSFAGQLGVGKTTLRALWERDSRDQDGTSIANDHNLTYWTLGAQYDLGSRTRVFAEIVRNEFFHDTNNRVEETDIFLVGYRVDF